MQKYQTGIPNSVGTYIHICIKWQILRRHTRFQIGYPRHHLWGTLLCLLKPSTQQHILLSLTHNPTFPPFCLLKCTFYTTMELFFTSKNHKFKLPCFIRTMLYSIKNFSLKVVEKGIKSKSYTASVTIPFATPLIPHVYKEGLRFNVVQNTVTVIFI